MIDPERLSLQDRIARLTPKQRADYVASLSEHDLDLLVNEDWSVIGRPDQFLPPGDWAIWLINAGRGWGKTRTGAEGTKERIRELAPQCATEGMYWALTAPREGDVLRVQLEGESGLLRCIPPSWLINGSVEDSLNRGALLLKLNVEGYPVLLEGFSARVLDGPRGRSFHGGWSDEPGTYPDAHNGLDGDERGESFMGNLLLGMRLGPFGGLIVTGTPKNNRLIRDLIDLPNLVRTRGRTRDNLHNLAPLFRTTVVARYAGTRLGRQELDGELLEGVGDLFQRGWFKALDPGMWPWPEGTEVRAIRYWDTAAGTESDSNPDPDWTVGTKIVLDASRRLYVIDHVARFRKGPGDRETAMANVAEGDGPHVRQVVEREPGAGGVSQIHAISRELDTRGISITPYPEKGAITGAKPVRAEVPALAAAQGRVYMRATGGAGSWAGWQLDLLDEAEEFPHGRHDDIVDTLSGGFAYLREAPPAVLLHAPAEAGAIPSPTQAARRAQAGRVMTGQQLPHTGHRTWR